MKLKNINQGQAVKTLLLIVIGVLVVLAVMKLTKKSTYRLSPAPITIENETEGDISLLPYNLSCVPGPEPTASYYTKSLTPGGACGDMEFIASQIEGYSIVDEN